MSSLWLALTLVGRAIALQMDASDTDSVIANGPPVVDGMMNYYNGNDTGESPGMFQDPYYWWEAGVAWGALLDWGYFSGNDSYDELTKMALVFQSGDYWDYMTYNQTSTEGNDDQAFWGISAMQAAERNFTSPGEGYPESWLYFAQATFNTMANRWDTSHCEGGLRWQIYTWNAGYNYKNLVSNGCLFNLASRLYRYTNNVTFADWAEKAFEWMMEIEFITPLNNNTSNYSQVRMKALDGAATDQNCTVIAPYEWTYNQGLLIAGCAFMYNATGNVIWYDRMQMLWSRAEVFFHNPTNIVYEAACQNHNACNNDQRCFKGIFVRMLGLALALVPETKEWYWDKMISSGQGMNSSCSGGTDGVTCGLNWWYGSWDGMYGLGEQINAVDMLSVLLVFTKDPPYTAKDIFPAGLGVTDDSGNETIYGYPDAGLNSSDIVAQKLNLNTSDKGGAGFVTALFLIAVTAVSGWLAL